MTINFGKKLAKIAETQFTSKRDFANTWGIHPGTLSKYIAGKENPGADKLFQLCALGIDMNYLLDESIEVEEIDQPNRINERIETYAQSTLDGSLSSVAESLERLLNMIISLDEDIKRELLTESDLRSLLLYIERVVTISKKVLADYKEIKKNKKLNNVNVELVIDLLDRLEKSYQKLNFTIDLQ